MDTTVVHPQTRIQLSNEKEQTTDKCNNTDDSQKHYDKWKKPDSNIYILYDSIYMTFGKM